MHFSGGVDSDPVFQLRNDPDAVWAARDACVPALSGPFPVRRPGCFADFDHLTPVLSLISLSRK